MSIDCRVSRILTDFCAQFSDVNFWFTDAEWGTDFLAIGKSISREVIFSSIFNFTRNNKILYNLWSEKDSKTL